LNQVISLYDKTGDGLIPWAAEGFECFAYHPLCRNPSIVRAFDGPGSISFVQLEQWEWGIRMARLVSRHRDKTAFLMASPPGEALSTGGARWWRQKFVADPDFQLKAMDVVKECSHVAEALGDVPFYIENPVGMLSQLWREPDHVFEPFQARTCRTTTCIHIGLIFCLHGMRIGAKSACGRAMISKCRRSCRYHPSARSTGRGRRVSVGASFREAFPAPYF
jgi:hypothetical protein